MCPSFFDWLKVSWVSTRVPAVRQEGRKPSASGPLTPLGRKLNSLLGAATNNDPYGLYLVAHFGSRVFNMTGFFLPRVRSPEPDGARRDATVIRSASAKPDGNSRKDEAGRLERVDQCRRRISR